MLHPEKPPSIIMFWPLMYVFLRLERKQTSSAISSGTANLPNGICVFILFIFSSDKESLVIDVNTKPGETEFTKTLCLDNSLAAVFVRPLRACLLQLYAARSGALNIPQSEDILIIFPYLFLIILFETYFIILKADERFVLITRSQLSSSRMLIGCFMFIAALLTQTSNLFVCRVFKKAHKSSLTLKSTFCFVVFFRTSY